MASGSRHEISFCGETTFGDPPITPTMLRFRNTGTTLNLSKDTFASDEIRSDREVSDLRHGNRRVQGDLNFELSYGAFDEWIAAALFGTWGSNVLKGGVTPQSKTIERRFLDIPRYLQYKGCMPTRMTLGMQPGNRMIAGSFGIIGKEMIDSSTSLGTPTDVALNPPMDSFTGSISEGGSPIATITGFNLTVDNRLDPGYYLGSALVQDIEPGRRVVTGNVTANFRDTALLTKFLNETSTVLSITIDGVGGDYTILLPRVKYTGGDIQMNGDQRIGQNLPFQALLDPTVASSIQITRVPG